MAGVPGGFYNRTPVSSLSDLGQSAPASAPTESTSFNWDQYTGGVTGQPTGGVDQTGSLYTGGYTGNTGIIGGGLPGSPLGGGYYGGLNNAGLSGGAQAWDQNSFQQQFGSPNTPQELEALESRLNAAGIKVSRNASGVAGKIILPNGQYVDVINSAGAGGKGFQWLTGDGGAPGGAAGGYAGGGSMGLANGSLMTPWTQDFHAPTADEAMNSPGLQFAMNEGQRGIENSAAAKGTLLTGGTLKDLAAYRTGAALQGYGDVYNRAVGEYGTARDNFYQNQDRPFSKLFNLSSLGANAANQTGGFGSQYSNNATGSLGDVGNANSAGSAAQGSIWGNYLSNIGQR